MLPKINPEHTQSWQDLEMRIARPEEGNGGADCQRQFVPE